MAKGKWTEREENIIRKLYLTKTAMEIAEKLGRTRAAVIARARFIGISVPSEVRIQRSKERAALNKESRLQLAIKRTNKNPWLEMAGIR